MPKLYEIEDQLVTALEAIMSAQEGGVEVAPDALTELQDLTVAAADKRDACRHFLQFVESREAELESDVKVAQAQLRSIKNAREHMEAYILDVMLRRDVVAANGARWKFVVAEGRDRVEITDERALLAEDNRSLLLTIQENEPNVRITVTPAKDNISLELKAGRKVAGAKLSKGEPSLQIKPLSARDKPGDTKFKEVESHAE